MPNSLENLMGDSTRPFGVALPHRLPVVVGRRGVEVVLKIGNADPFYYGYADATRLGMAWLREGVRARRQGRLAELTVHRHKLHCDHRAARQIAGWVLAKAAEAKFLSGDRQRVQVG